jgi:peptidoglycan L-alanyl-D-glutamate endopeptidase CwlK
MYKFSKTSKRRLNTCHPLLQLLFNRVIEHYDCSVLEGVRNKNVQNNYYKNGKSKLKYPKSKHNKIPSMAIDVAPYLNGDVIYDKELCYHFAGIVMGIAAVLGIDIRWGGDWDEDHDIYDQSFNDLVHFELVGK